MRVEVAPEWAAMRWVALLFFGDAHALGFSFFSVSQVISSPCLFFSMCQDRLRMHAFAGASFVPFRAFLKVID